MGAGLHGGADGGNTVLQGVFGGELTHLAHPAPVSLTLAGQLDKAGADGRVNTPYPGKVVQGADPLIQMALPLLAATLPGDRRDAVLQTGSERGCGAFE